jgi:hypothetical protein
MIKERKTRNKIGLPVPNLRNSWAAQQGIIWKVGSVERHPTIMASLRGLPWTMVVHALL